jgi:hypothetical protein
MEGGPTITRRPVPVMEEPQRVGDKFERRRTDTFGLPVDVETAARPMFCGEGRKSFLQEAAVEIRMMGDDEDDPAKQIIDGAFVNPVTGDHLIGNAGDFRYLRRDRKTEIFEPLPGAKNLVNPPLLAVIFKHADACGVTL